MLPFEQRNSLETVISMECRKADRALTTGPTLHHGCCTGADAAAHRIAFDLRMPIVIHPPLNERYKAINLRDGPFVTILPARVYHERNDDIATAADLLIACPQYPEDDERSARSGTWQTVRLARWHNVPQILVIEPDGYIRSDRETRRHTARAD
jgi:hypothetical protein